MEQERSGQAVRIYSVDEILGFAQADNMPELTREDAEAIHKALLESSSVEDSPEFFGVLGPPPQPKPSAAQIAALPKRLQALFGEINE